MKLLENLINGSKRMLQPVAFGVTMAAAGVAYAGGPVTESDLEEEQAGQIAVVEAPIVQQDVVQEDIQPTSGCPEYKPSTTGTNPICGREGTDWVDYICLSDADAVRLGHDLGSSLEYTDYTTLLSEACPGSKKCYAVAANLGDTPEIVTGEPILPENIGDQVVEPVDGQEGDQSTENVVEVREPKDLPDYESSPVRLGVYGGVVGSDGSPLSEVGVRVDFFKNRFMGGFGVGVERNYEDRSVTGEENVSAVETDTASGVGYFLETDTTRTDQSFSDYVFNLEAHAGGKVVDKPMSEDAQFSLALLGRLELTLGQQTETDHHTEAKEFYVNQELVQGDSVEHDPVAEDYVTAGLAPGLALEAMFDFGKHFSVGIGVTGGYNINLTPDHPTDEGFEVGAYGIIGGRF